MHNIFFLANIIRGPSSLHLISRFGALVLNRDVPILPNRELNESKSEIRIRDHPNVTRQLL
jgi:hypothetical protein